MDIVLRVSLLFFSTLYFFFVINAIKKDKLEFKYALTWLVSSLMLIIIDLFPHILLYVSRIFGIQSQTNAVFVCVIFLLLLIIFLNTINISANNKKNRILTQEIAIIKKRIYNLENTFMKMDNKSKTTD